MFELTGRHPGKTAYIVGKGPSLGFLRAEDFSEGIVIALNQAVYMVERLGIPNHIYSLQKDGCGLTGPHEVCKKRDGFDVMIRPQRAELILQATHGYSRDCLAGYTPVHFVDPLQDLGFQYPQTLAVRMGIAIAKAMLCRRIVMMCCDSLVNGSIDTFNIFTKQATRTSAGEHYMPSKASILRELHNTPHSLFIPSRRQA